MIKRLFTAGLSVVVLYGWMATMSNHSTLTQPLQAEAMAASRAPASRNLLTLNGIRWPLQ